MFIELTDHLRCVSDHDESFLVLLPSRMEGRRVLYGTLGCPVCQAEYQIEAGVLDLGAAPWPTSDVPLGGFAAPALLAFLGLEGPGGYVALVGEAARAAEDLAIALPGVHLVAINPMAPMRPSLSVSVLRAGRMPLKARSLRGVVVGEPASADPRWLAEAIRAVLPGLRATGRGQVPVLDGFELLGEADGWWVGVRR
jgi:hypothetical protein